MKEVTYSFKEFNQLLDAKKDDTQLLDLKNIKTITKIGAVLISLLSGSLTTTVYAATFSQVSSVTTCNFITDSLGDLKNMIIEAIVEAAKNMCIAAGNWVLNGIIGGSYYICLAIAIISVFAYIGGYRKAGKYVTISTVAFFILQSIKLFME